MKILGNGSQRLAGMHVSAGRHPNGLKPRMVEHLVVVVVDGDAKVLVLYVLLCPLDLMGGRAAHGHDASVRDSVEEGVDVTFALLCVSGELCCEEGTYHAAEADDSNVENFRHV